MKDIVTYCNELGSTNPTPGGGSASGLVLALAISSIEKAMRFSFQGQNKLIDELIELKNQAFKLSAEDEKYFSEWGEARKLPKITDDEKKTRQRKVDYYAEKCALVPFAICKIAIQVFEISKIFLNDCSKYLISDLACGVSFAFSSYEAGIYNILINLNYIKNEKVNLDLINFIKERDIIAKNKESLLNDIETKFK